MQFIISKSTISRVIQTYAEELTAFPLLAALKNVGELFVNDCVEISAWLEEGKE